MSVAIRLSRVGKKNAPMYRVVVKDSRAKRDGAYIENVGTYNPIKHQVLQFNEERIKYWVSQGAVVSEAVKKIHRIYKEKGISTKQVVA